MYLAKDNICVIYDDDESYAKRLMGIINDSKDIPDRRIKAGLAAKANYLY